MLNSFWPKVTIYFGSKRVRHWLANAFCNNSLHSQCPPCSPTQPPTTTCPREQLPQSDGLVRGPHGNVRIWSSSLPGATMSLIECGVSSSSRSVEVASGFSPTIRPHRGTHNPSHDWFSDPSSHLNSLTHPNSSYCPGWRDIPIHTVLLALTLKHQKLSIKQK